MSAGADTEPPRAQVLLREQSPSIRGTGSAFPGAPRPTDDLSRGGREVTRCPQLAWWFPEGGRGFVGPGNTRCPVSSRLAWGARAGCELEGRGGVQLAGDGLSEREQRLLELGVLVLHVVQDGADGGQPVVQAPALLQLCLLGAEQEHVPAVLRRLQVLEARLQGHQLRQVLGSEQRRAPGCAI